METELDGTHPGHQVVPLAWESLVVDCLWGGREVRGTRWRGVGDLIQLWAFKGMGNSQIK